MLVSSIASPVSRSSMARTRQSREPDRRRAPAACLRCRRSKLKCSGTRPCERCDLRSKDCVYDETERRVTVSASYLESLKHAASAQVGSTSTAPTRTGQDEPPEAIISASVEIPDGPTQVFSTPTRGVIRSGTIISPSFYANRPTQRRRWLYLGASSQMAFNLRVISMLRGDENEDAYAFRLDGDAYKVSWKRLELGKKPDLGGLPSLDFAIYLMNTVKFHLGSMFRLFDEDEFMGSLYEFYSDAGAKAESSSLFFIQYLVVLAMGQGLLSSSSSDKLSGSDYFSRAMSILPNDCSLLFEDSILAAEVLAMIALYFHCLDMKQSAYLYIGQAQRIALFEGMHTRLGDSVIGEKLAKRSTNIFWTIYILDRILSSTVGAPTSVQDSSIRNSLPSPESGAQRAAILSLHVKLARMTSQILSELCDADGSLETSYLTKVQSTLRTMADIARELEGTINLKFKNSVEALPKSAVHLRLMYHQCTILAIRPLLLSLLSAFLRSSPQAGDFHASLPSTIRDLLTTCVESATKTLQILEVSRQKYMLDTFLPFDLEYMSSAASVLIVLDEALRFVTLDPTVKQLSALLLEEMIRRGSVPAQFRKYELDKLRQSSRHFWKQLTAGRIEDDDPITRTRPTPLHCHDDSNPTTAAGVIGQMTSDDHTMRRTEDDEQGQVDHTRLPELLSAEQTPGFPAILDQNSGHERTLEADDLTHYFELDQQHMLEIADRLDVSALSQTFNFSDVTEDWVWSMT